MATPDIQIDRRIILEADTLVEAGHEVILLSGSDGSAPEFALMPSGLKLRRVTFGGVHPRVMFLARILYWGLNTYARYYQRHSSWSPRFYEQSVALANRAISEILRVSTVVCAGLTGWRAYDRYLAEALAYYRGDVYHAHDLPVLKACWWVACRHNAMLVYDAHELYPEICTLSRSQQRRLRRLEGRLIGQADLVITVNRLIAQELCQRYALRREPTVVQNAAEAPTAFDPAQRCTRLRVALGIPNDRLILLYQGWMAPHRSLAELVLAMKAARSEIVLVLLGYGEYREELRQLAAQHGLTERVRFLDAVPQEELLYYTMGADAGIIPYQAVDHNHLYCSPNKLYEFIVAGVPVLANDLPFLREVLRMHRIGLTYPLSTPETYTTAINLFMERGILEACRRHIRVVRHQFSWAEEKKNFLKCYEDMFTLIQR